MSCPCTCANVLIRKYGCDKEHPDFTVETWKEIVACGDTRQGYWYWVDDMLSFEEGEEMKEDGS